MKSLNKALRNGLAAVGILLSTQASAGGMGFPCCDLDGCWELGIEALYWQPCVCDWEYGIVVSQQTIDVAQTTNVLSVSPSYDWGFRLLGGYITNNCCQFLTVDWIYLRNEDATMGNPYRTLGNSAVVNATNRLKFRYNRVNFRGGYYLYRGCQLNFYTYAGIRWLNADQRRRIDGLVGSDVVRLREKASFNGAGLEFGIGGEYCTKCGISLVGRIGPTVALGQLKHKFTQGISSNSSGHEVYPERTSCAPGCDFRIGLSYGIDCPCYSVIGEIGYEMNYYYNLFTTISRMDGSTNNFLSKGENVGFGGPYASLKVRF